MRSKHLKINIHSELVIYSIVKVCHMFSSSCFHFKESKSFKNDSLKYFWLEEKLSLKWWKIGSSNRSFKSFQLLIVPLGFHVEYSVLIN
ncbi:CLUMA_CG002418, isoform A [Clunio marinus]|uniref:CLUMA_CG002418, isoform A n=1 Tax=Clunio marinus TaxID=568069 RepID=A0A1J1HM11_9DIPT|nr:CLUMA_CG002418, isoform A [Clunio marinus]